MARTIPKNGDFSQLLGNGENPNGFIAQTPNGTVRDGLGGDGEEFRFNGADGARWNADPRTPPPPLWSPPVEPSLESGAEGTIRVRPHTRRRPA